MAKQIEEDNNPYQSSSSELSLTSETATELSALERMHRKYCAPPESEPSEPSEKSVLERMRDKYCAPSKGGNLEGLMPKSSIFAQNEIDTTKIKPLRYDFNEIDADLAGDVEGKVREWFADRKITKSGDWLRVGNNGGLKVNLSDGHWADHSEDKSGHGLLSLYAWEFNYPKTEAARILSNGTPSSLPSTRRHKTPAPTQAAPDAEYELALTEPTSEPTFSAKLGEPSALYRYRTREGNVAMIVARFDTADGGKTIRQASWLRDKSGNEAWHPKTAPVAQNLLYNGEQLAQYPDKPVLIVEGEKCVHAIAETWKKWIILTWQGGTTTAAKADWSGFEGRDVMIWPDNDEVGMKAAVEIAQHIPHAKIVEPPSDKPQGWDVADAISEGWTNDQLYALTQAAAPLEAATEPEKALAVSIWDQVPAAPIATPYIDLDTEPEADDFKAFLKGVPLAEDCDLVVISARLKSFKSSIVAAMACSLVADDETDCLGFKLRGNGAVLIFDTEQSTKEIQNQSKAMRRRLGVASTPEQIKIVGLREYAPIDRMKIIKAAIEEQDEIAAVVVDGASDLCGNVNDPETSSTVVQFLMVAAVKANAPLFGVIHLNHSDREAMGGGRGHLGKEMERKAKSVVCVEKDSDGIGTIYAATTRRQPVSRDNGQRVQFCSEQNMVVSIEGTKADVKKAEKTDELIELADAVKIDTGTHVWKYSQLCKAIMSVEGVKDRTAKRRIKEMVQAEIVTHSELTGNYVLKSESNTSE